MRYAVRLWLPQKDNLNLGDTPTEHNPKESQTDGKQPVEDPSSVVSLSIFGTAIYYPGTKATQNLAPLLRRIDNPTTGRLSPFERSRFSQMLVHKFTESFELDLAG